MFKQGREKMRKNTFAKQCHKVNNAVFDLIPFINNKTDSLGEMNIILSHYYNAYVLLLKLMTQEELNESIKLTRKYSRKK